MAKYGMVIDETLCNGCYSCFLACRDEFCGNDYPDYSAAQPLAGMNWLRIVERERGKYPKVAVAYTSVLCMHCESASCVQKCPDGAVYRRPDGVVIVDPEKARGQKQIVATCPYRVIEWNEEQQLPQKCTFCAHLLDEGWKEPRCAEACPTRAIAFGDLDDPNSEVSIRLASGAAGPLRPEYQLGERVTYIGLPKKFIAGSVLFEDTGKCAKDVKVTISDDNESVVTITNCFGDFTVDGLSENTTYMVKLEVPDYVILEIEAYTRADVYLGDLVLSRLMLR
jgi:Fe-S-cluster-containing dehydrogenase component